MIIITLFIVDSDDCYLHSHSTTTVLPFVRIHIPTVTHSTRSSVPMPIHSHYDTISPTCYDLFHSLHSRITCIIQWSIICCYYYVVYYVTDYFYLLIVVILSRWSFIVTVFTFCSFTIILHFYTLYCCYSYYCYSHSTFCSSTIYILHSTFGISTFTVHSIFHYIYLHSWYLYHWATHITFTFVSIPTGTCCYLPRYLRVLYICSTFYIDIPQVLHLW